MAEAYTLDTFEPHVGTPFNVPDVEGGFTLQLAEAAATTQYEGQPREQPFRLVFTAPPVGVLPQRTYRLEHEALGELHMFIVPIGPDQPGGDIKYEAIFN